MHAHVLEASGVVDATGSITIVTPPVPPYGLFKAMSILVYDDDNDITGSIEVGVRSGTKDIPIARTKTALGKSIGWFLEWHGGVDQGNAMYARIQGATDGDHVRLIVHGFICSLAQA
jgi:hypothetical protein